MINYRRDKIDNAYEKANYQLIKLNNSHCLLNKKNYHLDGWYLKEMKTEIDIQKLLEEIIGIID